MPQKSYKLNDQRQVSKSIIRLMPSRYVVIISVVSSMFIGWGNEKKKKTKCDKEKEPKTI